MYGVLSVLHPNFCNYFVTFVILVWLGCLWWKFVELFSIFQLFRKKLKLNLVNFFVFYGLTMPKNMILIFLPPIYTLKILFVRPLIFTLHNRFFFLIGNSPYTIEWCCRTQESPSVGCWFYPFDPYERFQTFLEWYCSYCMLPHQLDALLYLGWSISLLHIVTFLPTFLLTPYSFLLYLLCPQPWTGFW